SWATLQNDPPAFTGGSYANTSIGSALPTQSDLRPRVEIPPVVTEWTRRGPREGVVVVVELLVRLIWIHIEQIARADRQVDLVEAISDLRVDERLAAVVLLIREARLRR